MNPKFSSTKGIQISMACFNKIQYHQNTKTLDVGAGYLFDKVYRVLSVMGWNIVGGSAIARVGVARWLLGGRYSLKTNQYRLGINNLLGIKLACLMATLSMQQRIIILHFWLLLKSVLFYCRHFCLTNFWWLTQGGGNNFGIVTKFTLATHEQSTVFFSWETWCVRNEERATREMNWCVNTKTNTHTHTISCSLSALNSNPKMGICPIFRNLLSSAISSKFGGLTLSFFDYKLFYVSLQL